MIAIDTNVLVRYYVDDDHAQHRKARHFIDENEIFINSIVVLEAFWVLTSVYNLQKETVGEIFDHLKRLSNVRFENEMVLTGALVAYMEDGCDFADAFVGLVNADYGFETASFDKKAARKLGFVLL